MVINRQIKSGFTRLGLLLFMGDRAAVIQDACFKSEVRLG